MSFAVQADRLSVFETEFSAISAGLKLTSHKPISANTAVNTLAMGLELSLMVTIGVLFNPSCLPRCQLLLFPERCCRFQGFHHKSAGIERIAPMRCPNRHHHNGFLWLDFPNTVDDSGINDLPLFFCIRHNFFQLPFRHAGIIVQRHALYAHALVIVPHRADENAGRAELC